MKHSRLKTLSFSCFIPSWGHKKSGTATEQFCSQWNAGSDNKHLANCGIWAKINEQHNYSVEILLWLENLEATDCVLVPPGHPRQLDGFCLPFQPAFSLRQKEQDGEGFIYSAIVSILSLSQAVSLAYRSGSWQLIHSGIAPSGNLAQWQPGLFIPLLVWLSFWLWGQWLKWCLSCPKTPDCRTPSSLKRRPSNRSDTVFFPKFLIPFSLIFLCTASIIRKLRKGPTMKQTPQAVESLDFWWSLLGGGWPLLLTWCT